MTRISLVLILTFLFAFSAHAGRKSKYFSLYGQYHSYSDIKNDSSNPSAPLSSDYSVNLDLRIFRIFLFTLHGGGSFDGTRTNYGPGLKMDLPGFFFLGGTINDLIRRKKRRGVNTSIHFKTYIISDETQGDDQYVGNRLSFTADIMFSKSGFLNLDIGLYSHRGNQYISPTIGLGYEF